MIKEFISGYREKTYEKMNKAEEKILEMKGVILYNELSRERGTVTIDDNSFKEMAFFQKLQFLKRILPNLRRCRNIQSKSVESLIENPGHPKTIADKAFIASLEKEAKLMGVNAVGYVKVPRGSIFKNRGILYENAIILTMEMDKEKIGKAPSFDTMDNVIKTYADLGEMANEIASSLRKNGYGAHASPALGGLVFYPALAEKAGMGVRGRHGLLISPGCGPRQRIAAVFTSIENLPVSADNSHEWIRDFCKNCGRCIKKCPPGAIYETPVKMANEEIRFVDGEKCLQYFSKNYGCSVCIKECPFNTVGYDNIKAGHDRKNRASSKDKT
ncbi:[Fe-S]-binding protein [Methanocella sp. CWC-04]|uniref:[Fe-S]-binding protein n=1 Tax=Methanooceanicella nereidis TaxID=2052831 RepID=A0AAP2RD44_9EURY|nr:4Fe-4S binding protein [Methanocella sp. CWC-04]MCD1294062.1 [Fe-S]-binding protein [Methanocella sp. CWC-04]